MDENDVSPNDHFAVQYRCMDGKLIAPIIISIAKKDLSSGVVTGLPLKAFSLAC